MISEYAEITAESQKDRKEGYDSVRLKLDDGIALLGSWIIPKLTSHYAPEPVKVDLGLRRAKSPTA